MAAVNSRHEFKVKKMRGERMCLVGFLMAGESVVGCLLKATLGEESVDYIRETKTESA